MTELSEAAVEALRTLDLDIDLISHLAVPESVANLRTEQFDPVLILDPYVREAFQFQMEHCREHNAPATHAVLEDELGLRLPPPKAAIGDLIERMRTRYMRNKGHQINKEIAKAVNEDPLGVAKIMLRGGRELADLTVKRGEIFGSGEFWRLMDLYDAKVLRGRGPSLGYKELNDHFYGLMGVSFLIGPPKSCKSWFAVNLIKDNILHGNRVYAYSLELPAHEYAMRLHHLVANIPYSHYLKDALMPNERRQLKAASDRLDADGTFFIAKPQPGERGVQRMIEGALNRGATMIVLDQLQYVETRKGVNLGSANNTGDYWEVCNDLRDYSDEIPIFCVHQFNRTVMGAQAMPEAQQAKGSAAVEEVATLALGLWADKEMRSNHYVHLGTLASRNYDHETWELSVELGDQCALQMLGKVVDDEEE